MNLCADNTRFSGIVRAILLILSVAIVVLIQEQYPHSPIKEKIKFKFNEGFPTFTPETIRALSFGYPRAISGLLWIRFLVQTPTERVQENEVSWIYLDLNAISIIDPDFVPIYSHGAMFLSVITEDKRGARLLLEKGVAKYPGFWRFRAYLAYHYQYVMGDLRKAAEQYEAASKLSGAPPFFSLLAATLYSKAGDKKLARIFIQSMLEGTRDPNIKKRFEEKLKSLKDE